MSSNKSTPKSGFFGSPRTKSFSNSSPLAVLRSFASLSNRGSPLSPQNRIKGNVTKTPDSPEISNKIQDKENLAGISSQQQQVNHKQNSETASEVRPESDVAKVLDFSTAEITAVQVSEQDSCAPPLSLQNDVCVSRYDAIADLDRANEDENWAERTSVITEWQHEEYINYATQFVDEIIEEVVVRNAGEERLANNDDSVASELDASFQSTATVEENRVYQSNGAIIVSDESEYESAADLSFADQSRDCSFAAEPQPRTSVDTLADILSSFQLKTPFTKQSKPLAATLAKEQPNPPRCSLDDSLSSAFSALESTSQGRPSPNKDLTEETIVLASDEEISHGCNNTTIEIGSLHDDSVVAIADEKSTDQQNEDDLQGVDEKHFDTEGQASVFSAITDIQPLNDEYVKPESSLNSVEESSCCSDVPTTVQDRCDEHANVVETTVGKLSSGSRLDSETIDVDCAEKVENGQNVDSKNPNVKENSHEEMEDSLVAQVGGETELMSTLATPTALEMCFDEDQDQNKDVVESTPADNSTNSGDSDKSYPLTLVEVKPDNSNELQVSCPKAEAAPPNEEVSATSIEKLIDLSFAADLDQLLQSQDSLEEKLTSLDNSFLFDKQNDSTVVHSKPKDDGLVSDGEKKESSENVKSQPLTEDIFASSAEKSISDKEIEYSTEIPKCALASNLEAETMKNGTNDVNLIVAEDFEIPANDDVSLPADAISTQSKIGSSEGHPSSENFCNERVSPTLKEPDVSKMIGGQESSSGVENGNNSTNEIESSLIPTTFDNQTICENLQEKELPEEKQEEVEASLENVLSQVELQIPIVVVTSDNQMISEQSEEKELNEEKQEKEEVSLENVPSQVESQVPTAVVTSDNQMISEQLEEKELPEKKEEEEVSLENVPSQVESQIAAVVVTLDDQMTSVQSEEKEPNEETQKEGNVSLKNLPSQVATQKHAAVVTVDDQMVNDQANSEQSEEKELTEEKQEEVKVSLKNVVPLQIEPQIPAVVVSRNDQMIPEQPEDKNLPEEKQEDASLSLRNLPSQVHSTVEHHKETTPSVSRVSSRIFESQSSSTPQNAEHIPHARPLTPVKRDVVASSSEAEMIKRHLFDSPAQKPTAIVKPCTDLTAAITATVTSSDVLMQEQLSEQQSDNDNKAVGKCDDLKTMGNEEKEEEAPIPSRGYNLDFLDDPNFNPFETRQGGIRESFGTSQPPSDDVQVGGEVVSAVSTVKKVASPRKLTKKSTETNSATTNENPSSSEEKKKTRKPLPPKPWLKKKTTKAKVSANEEDVIIFAPGQKPSNTDVAEPPKPEEEVSGSGDASLSNDPPIKPPGAYNLDFLDDPNFNPFETKSKVVNEGEVPKIEQNTVENDRPFECGPLVPEIVISGHQADDGHVSHVKDSTPEFEAVEKECFSEEKNDQTFEFVKPDVIPVHQIPNSEMNGSEDIQANDTLAKMGQTFSGISQFSPDSSLSKSKSFSDRSSVDLSNTFDMTSSLAFTDATSTQMVDSIKDTLARKELVYQAQLLEKDKELHKREREIQQMEQEMVFLRRDIKGLCESNDDMVQVLREFERTISELTSERERDRVVMEIEKERLLRDRDTAINDLRSVERSLADTHGRYERMKEVIGGFKKNEDHLKEMLQDVTSKYRKSEEKFERLRAHAESKLNEANETLAAVQKSRDAEVAKLTAMLRKAEMRVSTLERTVEEKARENKELTQICDDIIARVGK